MPKTVATKNLSFMKKSVTTHISPRAANRRTIEQPKAVAAPKRVVPHPAKIKKEVIEMISNSGKSPFDNSYRQKSPSVLGGQLRLKLAGKAYDLRRRCA